MVVKFLRQILYLFLLLCAAGAHANYDVAGDDTNLAWALKHQLQFVGYQIQFVNFSSPDPMIVAIDRLDIDAPDSRTIVDMLAKRYEKCVAVDIDDQNHMVTVTPRDLFHVRSHHVEESTFSVDGGAPFTVPTRTEDRDRYYCLHDPSKINQDWQKRAFLKVQY